MESKNLHVGQKDGDGDGDGAGHGNGHDDGSRRRWLRAWGPAVAWAALEFAFSSVPGRAYPTVEWNFADKAVHFAVFFVLGVACARGVARGRGIRHPGGPAGEANLGRAFVAGALLATGYGVLDELHQIFVPGRSADWRDVLADAAGALVGAAVYVAHRRRRPTATNDT